MSIYHMSAKVIGRNSGRSSVAAAAYRSGETLVDERQGLTHDYTNKKGVEHTEIMLPENAPAEYADRQTLWNEVEKAEKDSKAQLAREIEIALPVEFNRQKQIDVLHQYVQENFVDNGMIADIALHDMGDGNPHAHIMLTMRPLDETGKWQSKSEKVYLCMNRQGEERGFTAQELKQQHGEWEKQLPYYKNGKGKPVYITKHLAETDNQYQDYIRVKGKNSPKKSKADKLNKTVALWNDKGNVEMWRSQWAAICNRVFVQERIRQRIDHRSYDRQGKERIATIHLGASAAALERRGYQTERGKYNEEVKALNRQLKALTKSIKSLQQEHIAEQAASEPKYMDDIQLGETLASLKNDYTHLELQKLNTQTTLSNLGNNAGDIRFALRDINEIIQNIESRDKEINKLKESRSERGFFRGKEKKTIDETIRRFEESKDYYMETLRDKYGVTPDNANEKMKEMRSDLALIYKQRNDINNTRPIEDKQKSIEQQYIKAHKIAMKRPGAKKIVEIEEQNVWKPSGDLNKLFAWVHAESHLQDITREEKKINRVIELER